MLTEAKDRHKTPTDDTKIFFFFQGRKSSQIQPITYFLSIPKQVMIW